MLFSFTRELDTKRVPLELVTQFPRLSRSRGLARVTRSTVNRRPDARNRRLFSAKRDRIVFVRHLGRYLAAANYSRE